MQTIICLGAFFSTGFGLGLVHQQAPKESPMVNDDGGLLDYTPGADKVLVGMKSESIGKYDRAYQMYFAEGEGIKCNPGTWTSWKNDWDDVLDYYCPTYHALAGIQSEYSSKYRDRRFKLRCCDLLDGGYFIVGSVTSGWINFWDQPNDFECNPQEVVIGLTSRHNNDNEDRRWKVTCGLLQNQQDIQYYLQSNDLHDYVNTWHEDFTIDYSGRRTDKFGGSDGPYGWILWGLRSEHDNNQEDRRWRPYSAVMPAGMTCSPQAWSEYQNDPDEEFTFQCPDNSVMVGFSSKYNSNARDRQFRFRCCDLGGGWSVTSTRYMGWANDLDEDMVGKCGLNEAWLGFKSYHNNDAEDRRFNFICGMLEQNYDDCSTVKVVQYEIDESAISYGEEQIKTMSKYSSDFEQCGSPIAADSVTITIANEESVEMSETFSLTNSLDKTFSFSQEIETTFTIGQTITNQIEASVNAGMFSAGGSTEVSTSYEFALRTAIASEQGFTVGSEDTTTTETATVDLMVFSTEATYSPEPFQWHQVSAEYIEREVIIPVRMEAQCIRGDGKTKTEWINTQIVGAATTQVSVKYEDLTPLCPQSYYHNCECVTGLASDFIGTGCQVHPNFAATLGCYVYAGQEGCGNGGGLAAAKPAENQLVCTDLETCPGSQSYLDYPVDANMFEWSYIPCGGLQYYPGDAGWTGPEYGDLVWKHELVHCADHGGYGTLGYYAYSTWHEAIEMCDYINYNEPNTCYGIYDGGCDGVNYFHLCSTEELPLMPSGSSCVYEMQVKDPVEPVGGTGRRRSEEMVPPGEEVSRTCADLRATFADDLDLTDCNDGTL